MRLLPRTDPRPIHLESPRAHMARQVSPMQRMSSPVERQVFCPQRPTFLQRGFFQVSIDLRLWNVHSSNINRERILIIMTVCFTLLWVTQTIRHQVFRLRPGHSSDPSGPTCPGQRLPPTVLRLCDLLSATEHGRWVLPDGRPKIGVQTGLRGSQGQGTVHRRITGRRPAQQEATNHDHR